MKMKKLFVIFIAALALNRNSLYHYNSEVFTRLYKLTSTDPTLEDYCNSIKMANRNKKTAHCFGKTDSVKLKNVTITGADIAAREELSQKYSEAIMTTLSKGGLVEGIHGKGGGYRLSRKPEEYSLAEVLTLTEGSLAPVSCLCDGASPCDRSTPCPTLPVWEELERIITEYLSSVTLADILPKE